MSEQAEPSYAWTNMGWGPEAGPWRYRVLSEVEISTQLGLYANAAFDAIAQVSSVTFQPCLNEEERSQDRRVVQSWDFPDGRWSFTGVFDGHAGHETVDHAAIHLPLLIKSKLTSVLSQENGTLSARSSEDISGILTKSIVSYDESLLADLAGLFPEGLDGMSKLSPGGIEDIINDGDHGGENLAKVHRCMRGSTVLVSLVDPSRENLWVANLGDCQAVLGTKLADGKWAATPLSCNHNGENDAEVKRVRDEHPGEDECILRQRVLGAIAVTRALGDYEFKLPARFSTDLFLHARPGFTFKASSIHDWIARNLTPPYLSRHPDVVHHRLCKGGNDGLDHDVFLIMCSDGLYDRFRDEIDTDITFHWVSITGGAVERGEGENAALVLLRDALGGQDSDKVSRFMTLEIIERWMDDTTITVQTF